MRILRFAGLVALCAASAVAQGQRPLEASLRRGALEPVFSVDQPAYVVVFEVIPGLGVQQIFPRSTLQANQPVDPGEYLLSRPLISQTGYGVGWGYSVVARPMYIVDGFGNVKSYYYATGYSGIREFTTPRTILMVASRKPLRRVGSPEAARFWLQQVAGFRVIANTIAAPESMLTDIVDAVLPLGSLIDDVVVDVLEFVDPPFSSVQSYMASALRFSCPGGQYALPFEFDFGTGLYSCPYRFNTVIASNQPSPTGPPVSPGVPVPPGDEDGYKLHKRRLPTPFDKAGSDRGNEGVSLRPRATIRVGDVTPVTYSGSTRGGVNPATGAWVPPTPSGKPSDYGYGAGRFSPAGTSNGYGSGSSGSTASASSAAAASAASSQAAAAAQASAAQSARSTEYRNAVSAAAKAAPVDPKPPTP